MFLALFFVFVFRIMGFVSGIVFAMIHDQLDG